MAKNFDKSLSDLKNGSVLITASYASPESASVQLLFADGSTLRADYWRVIKDGKEGRSSFDHQQQYGLPTLIDAIKELQEYLQDRIVTDARLDRETGDLLFQFTENVKLQVFSFTGYEVWEISFPDGAGEYSNHVK